MCIEKSSSIQVQIIKMNLIAYIIDLVGIKKNLTVLSCEALKICVCAFRVDSGEIKISVTPVTKINALYLVVNQITFSFFLGVWRL